MEEDNSQCFFSSLVIILQGISKSYVERSNQLRKTISSDLNYRDYRAKLKTVQAPCIPFLGKS